MNTRFRHHLLGGTALGFAFATSLSHAADADDAAGTPTDPDTVKLEKFIVESGTVEASTSLMPTSRQVDSIYGSAKALADTPRALTVLTPETLRDYGIKDVYDFARAVPGASVVNYYGVPGIPTTRGLMTSIYFNGMLRVWNRNGYPTSFGSLESMDYVRGPAPATYSAATPGGFVNFIPKSPYFDSKRSNLTFTMGENNEYNTQIDVGGPFLIGGTPAAGRLSLTNQEADSHYTGIFNNYTSLYGSIKVKLSDKVTLYTGGEFYRHRSKENPGWNRVTQDLIDNQMYLTGSPKNDLTGASVDVPGLGTFQNDAPGFVNRVALETATPFGGSRGSFDGSFLAQSGFASSGFNAVRFANNAGYNFLGNIDNTGLHTVKLDTKKVLTDYGDFTNADTYLWFADLKYTADSGMTITNKSLIDGYHRDKRSSYGYGEYGTNFTFENKTLVANKVNFLKGLNLTSGFSIRVEDALAKTEFTVEPFNRRDISIPATPNDRLMSGNQRGVVGPFAGKTYWDPFGSWKSLLVTPGLFTTPELKVTDSLTFIGSARVDKANWSHSVPYDLAGDFNSGKKPSGDKTYTNYSLSGVYKITPMVTAYATAQRGTAFQGFYVSGGVDAGDQNFQESSLAEGGFKVQVDGTLYSSINYFYQELVNFDSRGGSAMPQRGAGVEWEGTWEPTPHFSLTANATWQRHYYRSATLPGGFVPLTPEETVKFAGIFTADFGGRPNPGGARFGIPEVQTGFLARYAWDNGISISGGPSYTDAVWGNPDKTLRLHSYTLVNLNIGYSTKKWDFTISCRNLTDKLYFTPFEAFAANTIILPGAPRTFSGTFRYHF